MFFLCFFFNDTATTEIYTLSLHDALPIFAVSKGFFSYQIFVRAVAKPTVHNLDRKSTRLNSSHRCISYAVFCLKKKTPVHVHEIEPIASKTGGTLVMDYPATSSAPHLQWG